MSGQDFIVPPRSWDEIDKVCEEVREIFKLSDEPHFPITDFLEKVLDQKLDQTRFLVGDHREMGNAEGLTCPSGTFIMLREDVYVGSLLGNGRDRFTAAHELGHWVLHTNVPLARATCSGRVDAFKRSEPQANRFAAGLLMPRRFFQKGDTAIDVMIRHGVSQNAAENRLDALRRKGIV